MPAITMAQMSHTLDLAGRQLAPHIGINAIDPCEAVHAAVLFE